MNRKCTSYAIGTFAIKNKYRYIHYYVAHEYNVLLIGTATKTLIWTETSTVTLGNACMIYLAVRKHIIGDSVGAYLIDKPLSLMLSNVKEHNHTHWVTCYCICFCS